MAQFSGRIDLYGRVASLLEVGTGFHPELTGRENIYLNGAILGTNRSLRTRRELARSRHWFSSGIDGPRKYLFEWRNSRDESIFTDASRACSKSALVFIRN